MPPLVAAGFIAQVTLYSAALGLAISKICYANSKYSELTVLQQLLTELDLVDVLIQADGLHTQQPFIGNSRSMDPTACWRASQRLL